MVPPPTVPSVASANPPADAHRWFNQEVHPHGSDLKAYVGRSFPGLRSEAEDIAQESFLAIWKEKTLRPIHCARAFLFTLARHIATDQVRRSRRSPVTTVGDLAALNAVEDRPGIQSILAEQEKIVLLGRAIASLPARRREIIILHKLKGHSQSEIAFRLRLTEKAVQHDVSRGIRACEAFFHHHGIEHF